MEFSMHEEINYKEIDQMLSECIKSIVLEAEKKIERKKCEAKIR